MIVGRCRFCGLSLGTSEETEACYARALLPGENLPHERETPGERMTRHIAEGSARRAGFGRRKRK